MALEAHKQKYRDLIDALKKADDLNETRGDACVRFSRACRGCGLDDPPVRLFSTECGHAVCRACADGKGACVVCDEVTDFVKLFEDSSSRECGVCLAPEPMSRDVFTECGHILCSACVVGMRLSMVSNWRLRFRCPFCDKQKKYKRAGSWNARKLLEEPIESTVIIAAEADLKADSEVSESTSTSCLRDFFCCLFNLVRKPKPVNDNS